MWMGKVTRVAPGPDGIAEPPCLQLLSSWLSGTSPWHIFPELHLQPCVVATPLSSQHRKPRVSPKPAIVFGTQCTEPLRPDPDKSRDSGSGWSQTQSELTIGYYSH